MKETKRIAGLFEKLYDGSPWIDVNLSDALAKITAKKAATHIFDNCNSIWEIVNHLINWRQNVLKRIQGKVIKTPDNNYFENIADSSDFAWKRTLEKLDNSQRQWLIFLDSFKADDFSKVYPNNQMTYYEHIHGIIQHDAYHLGQIILLTKCLG